ncbi:hypothetical protein PIB30_094620, partial [Stylosanthes scabra]|nr:hypothetical protein [Stylosanthes scabra]
PFVQKEERRNSHSHPPPPPAASCNPSTVAPLQTRPKQRPPSRPGPCKPQPASEPAPPSRLASTRLLVASGHCRPLTHLLAAASSPLIFEKI